MSLTKAYVLWPEAMLMYNLHLLYCSVCLPVAHAKKITIYSN